MAQRAPRWVTPEEYLAREVTAEYKSEYRNGQVVALAGASVNHNQIVTNITIAVGQALKGKPCRVFASDMRLHVARSGLYTYPDVMIICGKIEIDPRQEDTVMNPIILVEVWSDSTKAYDRVEKFDMYRTIPSLHEYIMIDQTQPRVEHYRRDGHFWVIETLDDLKSVLKLGSINAEIPVKDIYAQVEWKEKPKGRKKNK